MKRATRSERTSTRASSKTGKSCTRQHWRKTSRVRNMCHETETQLHQQRSSDSCFSLCSLDWNCHRSAERASNRSKAGELWMEFGLQPRDRRQARREHRTGSQLSHMVASRAPCLNRVQGPAHRVCWAHFDNRERQAGMELCIYCDVGFGFRFSPPIWGVVDPRGGMAKLRPPLTPLLIGRAVGLSGLVVPDWGYEHGFVRLRLENSLP